MERRGSRWMREGAEEEGEERRMSDLGPLRWPPGQRKRKIKVLLKERRHVIETLICCKNQHLGPNIYKDTKP
jgi:hypothetical protein